MNTQIPFKPTNKNSKIRKRSNDRENEVITVNRPVNYIPHSYGDRFIPRRYNGFTDQMYSMLRAKYINTDILEMKERSGYWRLHTMDFLLNDILNDNSKPNSRVLSFSDNFNRQQVISEPSTRNEFRLDWDCKPRQKPKAFIEAIHDLPILKKTYGKHVIDWSERNEIAAVLNMKMVMWTLFTEKTTAYLLFDLSAVAFDATGNYLALAVSLNNQPVVQIWDTACYDKRYLIYTEELQYTKELADTEVTAVIWDNGTHIFCGCLCGTLFVFCLSQKLIIHVLKSSPSYMITEMKFSCKYQYLAVCDETHTLTIYYWNGTGLQTHSHVQRSSPLAFDFHPWKNTELVIAEVLNSRIVFVDLHGRKMITSYSDKAKRCLIHTISFNKITAELVCSLEHKDTQKFEILVLGAMDRVVDVLNGHEKQVHHIIWSPDGQIMGTAGEDRTFILWNFFGLPNVEQTSMAASKSKEKKKRLKYFKTAPDSKLSTTIR